MNTITITDLTTLTPAEVDTRLGEALIPAQRTELDLMTALRSAKRYARHGSEPSYLTKRIAELKARLEGQLAVAEPFEAEYRRRPWNRYLIVSGGHLHKRGCGTLTPGRTMVGMVPEASGLNAAEVVGRFGETACTHCFPDAPVAARKTPEEEGFCEHSGRAVPEGKLPKEWWRRYGLPRVACECGYRGAVTSAGRYRKHKPGGAK
jgi:hypothetical protein